MVLMLIAALSLAEVPPFVRLSPAEVPSVENAPRSARISDAEKLGGSMFLSGYLASVITVFALGHMEGPTVLVYSTPIIGPIAAGIRFLIPGVEPAVRGLAAALVVEGGLEIAGIVTILVDHLLNRGRATARRGQGPRWAPGLEVRVTAGAARAPAGATLKVDF